MISNDIISFEHITHISQKTTEQINQKNLKSFLITSLDLHNVSTKFYNNIYYVYFSQLNQYEIYAFNSYDKNTFLEYQLFSRYYDTKNIIPLEYDLFITENYFCIYKNGKFYFAKENCSYHIDEIIEYLNISYGIKIDRDYIIDKEQINYLKAQSNQLEKLKTFIIKSKRSIVLPYIVSFLIATVGLLYSIMELNHEIEINKKKQLELLKKEYYSSKKKGIKTNYTQEIFELFNLLKQNEITLLKFRFDKKYYITLQATKKELLFSFIKNYTKKIVIHTITNNVKEQNYIVELYIEKK